MSFSDIDLSVAKLLQSVRREYPVDYAHNGTDWLYLLQVAWFVLHPVIIAHFEHNASFTWFLSAYRHHNMMNVTRGMQFPGRNIISMNKRFIWSTLIKIRENKHAHVRFFVDILGDMRVEFHKMIKFWEIKFKYFVKFLCVWFSRFSIMWKWNYDTMFSSNLINE